uniref:Schlafen AlbA-2 domain-containing protein n=1 Tax=Leptobrachium leishanense TaxID=445787 RepID=A0A8C5MZG7_9ANUR
MMTSQPTRRENEKPLEAQNSILPFPDRIVMVGSATLGEKQRQSFKKKDVKQQQKESILKAVCALLNSGGGLVVVDIEDKQYNFKKHSLGLDIVDAFGELFSNSSTPDYIDILQHGSHLIIFVKSWTIKQGFPRISCLKTGFYIRSTSSKIMANPMQVLEKIESKTKSKRIRLNNTTPSVSELLKHLRDRQSLELDEELPFSESQNIEFKDFNMGKWQTRMRDVIPEYCSAFGNTDGGCLIIGVHDDGKVKGCCAESKATEIKSVVEMLVKKTKCFHIKSCSSDEDLSWELLIKNVHDNEQKHLGYVIILIIQQFCCLAFADSPESWIIESDPYTCPITHLKQFKTSVWIEKMSPDCKEIQSLATSFTQLRLSDNTPFMKPVYTKNRHESLRTVREELFRVIPGELTITPEHLYQDLCEEEPQLCNIIKQWIQNEEGLLILSRSWATDIGLKRNLNVVCDALLISTKTYPKLYTVFNAVISQAEIEYSRLTAFTLKQKLVLSGGYTGKLCIIPEAVSLDKENNHSLFSCSKIIYPPQYELVSVKDLLDSLVVVLLQFKSFLSDRVGMEIFHLLTIEQYKLLSRRLSDIRHLFVHGLPGSGKTVVAVELMKKIKNHFLCEKKNILYICENQPLRDYIGNLGICVSVTRTTFVRNDFPQVKHIIVDEAQNFQLEKNEVNWYEKANKLFQNAGDSNIFCVFMDYFQTSHNFANGLPPIGFQSKERLTKVIRNCTEIHNFMLEPLEQIVDNSNTSRATYLEELLRESECSHNIDGFCIHHSLDESGIIKYVTGQCIEYMYTGYSPQDIAILCNTVDDANDYKEKLSETMRKHRLQLQDASAVHRNVIVLDSVRRFSGLERNIVFVIDPVPSVNRIKDNLLVCAASRAIMKLHVLYKKNQA